MLLEDNIEYYYCENMKAFNSAEINLFNISECYEGNQEKVLGWRFACSNYIVDGIINPVIALFGILGNIYGIIHFAKNRDKMPKSKTYFSLMLTLAISDLILIVSMICQYSLPLMIPPNRYMESSLLAYVDFLTWPISNIFQISGIYLAVFVCIERYYTICKPLSHHEKKRSVSTYMLIVICLMFTLM